MRIRAASQALGVPIPTLRRWTQEFAAGLSPEARASEGRPRDFSARDMRVLRRAKEILGRDDMTYERARRELTAESLMRYEAEGEAAEVVTRDEAAEREAAERFVREVVERTVAPVRDGQAALAARVGQLERELQTLQESLGGADGYGRGVGVEGGERRRAWPFRTG